MPDDQKPISPNLEILGQKFYLPDTELKLKGLGMILLTLLIALILLVVFRYGIKKNADGFSITGVEIINQKVDKKTGYTICFWTPSDSTKKGLLPLSSGDSSEYYWEVKPEDPAKAKFTFDSLNKIFGDELMYTLHLKGYRRYRVWGDGMKKFKEGWWWNIGLEGTYDDQVLKDLKTAYIKFWHPGAVGNPWDRLYVEVIGN